MSKTTATICSILAAGMLLLAAQENALPAAAPAAAETVTPAASVESPMETIMRLFGDSEKQHQKFMADFQTLNQRIQSLPQIAGNSERLEEALRLKRMLVKFTDRIDIESEKHIALKNRIDRHVAGARLLKQESAYLDTYVDGLQSFGIDQQKAAATITAAGKFLTRQINAVPPPAVYRSDLLGIEMHLIIPQDRKLRPFYVSTAPITAAQWSELRKLNSDSQLPVPPEGTAPDSPMTGITFQQALAAVSEITRLYGGKYMLPSTAEAVAMVKSAEEQLPDIAVWLRGKWTGNYREEEAAQRFGMGLNTIWDPSGRLTRRKRPLSPAEAFESELPQAQYKLLGMIIVTPAQTGKINAIREAEAALDAEEKFTSAPDVK